MIIGKLSELTCKLYHLSVVNVERRSGGQHERQVHVNVEMMRNVERHVKEVFDGNERTLYGQRRVLWYLNGQHFVCFRVFVHFLADYVFSQSQLRGFVSFVENIDSGLIECSSWSAINGGVIDDIAVQ